MWFSVSSCLNKIIKLIINHESDDSETDSVEDVTYLIAGERKKMLEVGDDGKAGISDDDDDNVPFTNTLLLLVSSLKDHVEQ